MREGRRGTNCVCWGGGGVKKTKRIGEGENKDGVRGKIRGRKEKGLRERGRTKNDWGGGGKTGATGN